MINDDGIESPALVDVFPNQSVLSGTAMYVSATAPEGFEDAGVDSLLEVTEGANVTTYPLDGQVNRVDTTLTDPTVSLKATLTDRSQNSVDTEITLAKRAFLTDQTSVVGTTSSRFAGLAQIAGRDSDIVWAENLSLDGYRLMDSSGELHQSNTGTLETIGYSGNTLYAVVMNNGLTELVTWSLSNGVLQSAQSQTLSGELIGANGEVFYWVRGRELGVTVLNSDRAIAGIVFDQDITDSVTLADQIIVLVDGQLRTFTHDSNCLLYTSPSPRD